MKDVLLKIISCLKLSVLIALCSPAVDVHADNVHVAVASNFSTPIQKITHIFEQATGHNVIVSVGSSGKHFAQIKNGAPFDLFLAADIERPKRLEQEGIALPDTRFTYAIGQIVLWRPSIDATGIQGDTLHTGTFNHLAIANPKHAPYGLAAKQIMQAKGIWDKLRHKTVRGENIGQAFQFVQSGNAQLGFVAYSQVKHLPGSLWVPPQTLYSPIEQQAVLLRDNSAAREFITFIQGPAARTIIQNYGYKLP